MANFPTAMNRWINIGCFLRGIKLVFNSEGLCHCRLSAVGSWNEIGETMGGRSDFSLRKTGPSPLANLDFYTNNSLK
jgi:hypothetical protein